MPRCLALIPITSVETRNYLVGVVKKKKLLDLEFIRLLWVFLGLIALMPSIAFQFSYRFNIQCGHFWRKTLEYFQGHAISVSLIWLPLRTAFSNYVEERNQWEAVWRKTSKETYKKYLKRRFQHKHQVHYITNLWVFPCILWLVIWGAW